MYYIGVAYARIRKRNERFFHGSLARNSYFIPDRNRPILSRHSRDRLVKRTDYTSLASSASACCRLAASSPFTKDIPL